MGNKNDMLRIPVDLKARAARHVIKTCRKIKELRVYRPPRSHYYIYGLSQMECPLMFLLAPALAQVGTSKSKSRIRSKKTLMSV